MDFYEFFFFFSVFGDVFLHVLVGFFQVILKGFHVFLLFLPFFGMVFAVFVVFSNSFCNGFWNVCNVFHSSCHL